MSTSRRTRSGITFTLVPACMTVGAMVVWVQAWAWRARPSAGNSSQKAPMASGSSSGPAMSGGSPIPSTKRRQASWMSAAGWYSARRRTTSAALTRALSVRSGCEACPGVPRTVKVHQKTPFSPVRTGRRTPSGDSMGKPPASVMR